MLLLKMIYLLIVIIKSCVGLCNYIYSMKRFTHLKGGGGGKELIYTILFLEKYVAWIWNGVFWNCVSRRVYATHVTAHNPPASVARPRQVGEVQYYDQLSASPFLTLVCSASRYVQCHEKQLFYSWIDFRRDRGLGTSRCLWSTHRWWRRCC
jgi:hypothetical protein